MYAFRVTGCAGGACYCLAAAVPSSAQYFGRNKVQYERFDFKVLATEHFDIYYYPEEEAAVRLAARMAERWHARLTRLLQHELSGRQPLILYAAHPHFQQTNILGEIGEGTGGVTESNRRRVILPFAGGLAETDHVLGHELVHAFQYDIAAQTDRKAGRRPGPRRRCRCGSSKAWRSTCRSARSIRTPRCGCAKRRRAMRCRRSTSSTIPDFFPYRYGHAFWAYVAGRWGDRVVGDLLRATGPDGNIEAAIAAVLGIDEDQLTDGVARRHAGDRSRRSTKRRGPRVHSAAR